MRREAAERAELALRAAISYEPHLLQPRRADASPTNITRRQQRLANTIYAAGAGHTTTVQAVAIIRQVRHGRTQLAASPNYSWEQALGDGGAAHQPG
jgi:D-serine deaminase-like pyridoxal phosphate-dependent protein